MTTQRALENRAQRVGENRAGSPPRGTRRAEGCRHDAGRRQTAREPLRRDRAHPGHHEGEIAWRVGAGFQGNVEGDEGRPPSPGGGEGRYHAPGVQLQAVEADRREARDQHRSEGIEPHREDGATESKAMRLKASCAAGDIEGKFQIGDGQIQLFEANHAVVQRPNEGQDARACLEAESKRQRRVGLATSATAVARARRREDTRPPRPGNSSSARPDIVAPTILARGDRQTRGTRRAAGPTLAPAVAQATTHHARCAPTPTRGFLLPSLREHAGDLRDLRYCSSRGGAVLPLVRSRPHPRGSERQPARDPAGRAIHARVHPR